ncbi:ATP-binding protein [Pandoraea sputorum]|uniref:ATP-binding protein n=1 Tax=Pandoraea sputorum TaxID=93222 RepID=A0A5E5BKZ1_9BURK|nr:ATP-binding protein [Pandoraea sputorum]
MFSIAPFSQEVESPENPGRLTCAFGQQACRQGFSVLYVRVARLFEELKIAHGDGSFTRRLAQLAQMDVLLLDDWGLQDVDQGARNDLLEVLDDRPRVKRIDWRVRQEAFGRLHYFLCGPLVGGLGECGMPCLPI